MRLERLALSEWDGALPDQGTEPFHAPEALGVLDEHTPGELQLFAGYNGDRPVALLPVFSRSTPLGRILTSPPPGMGVSRLGPVLMPASPKRSKREKLNREFTDLVIEATRADSKATLLRMMCPTAYGDPRPYVWDGLDVDPLWTYRLTVDGRSTDDLLAAASKSLRREITDAAALDVTVEREGLDGTRAVFDETRKRYAEQGEALSVSWPYVRDLVKAMRETDRARTYVARDGEGRFLTGITVLYSNDAAYFWQGGTRCVHDGVAVNGLLHWNVIEDIAEDPPRPSVGSYDLLGANTERLSRYKSKFGSTLTPYYVVESSGIGMTAAKKAYELVGR